MPDLGMLVSIASPILATGTVFASAWLGRHAGRAAVKQAATDERKAASADWASYTAELRQDNADLRKHNVELSDRVEKVEQRVDDSELRAAAAELRASKAEKLYALAVVYLRRISHWVNDYLPAEKLPPPPPELEADL